MRRALDRLYDAAAQLAALFLIGTLVMVLIGIAERFLGFHLPGTDAFAGYCMAGAGFLALAHTLKRGEHIRVTLLLEHAQPPMRRILERGALLVATALAALLAFYSAKLAYQSWDFHDISTGNDATPLWLPQLTMALGTAVLFIALVDELVLEWRGVRRAVASSEVLHNE
ncbi:MAG: TRAP transporter small permease [Pseudomonadota bacterium]|nr:TRAP transporter small permease [Pseudomonadota bacterium]